MEKRQRRIEYKYLLIINRKEKQTNNNNNNHNNGPTDEDNNSHDVANNNTQRGGAPANRAAVKVTRLGSSGGRAGGRCVRILPVARLARLDATATHFFGCETHY